MFNACTNKNSAFKYFNKSKLEVQAIQNSKKIDILEENEPKTLIWVTYLNKIEGYEDTASEKFLISLYFPNAKNQNLLSLDYDILLNDNKFTNIQKIDKYDEKYSKISNTNSWGNSYLVEFHTMKEIYKLNLKLSINSSLAQLEFEK